MTTGFKTRTSMAVAAGLLATMVGTTPLPHARAGGEPSVVDRAREAVRRTSKTTTAETAESCNRFAFDLYRQMTSRPSAKNNNVVVAPYSVAETLALAYAGARGKTAEEIAKTLRLKSSTTETGPAFASLDIGAGAQLRDEVGSKPRFGVRVQDSDGAGVVIAEVKKDSPAWQAGLRPKDKIIRLGSFPTRDVVAYVNALDTFVNAIEGEVRDEKGTRAFSAQLNTPSATQSRLRPLIANGIWGRQGLQFAPAFRDYAEQYFNANVATLDFAGNPKQARTQINRSVADATEDGIPSLLPMDAITADTAIVLTNAVFLEAAWRFPFKSEMTSDEIFYSPGKKHKVPMMHRSGRYRYGEGDDFQVIELPLEGDFAMAFFLPRRKNGKDTLVEFEAERFNAEKIPVWLAKLEKTSTVPVSLTLPRFRVNANNDLREALTELGMVTAFTRDSDFSGMISQSKLSLTSLAHSSQVEINEKGVRASAGTGAVASPRERSQAEFTADHPFLFTIRDTRTGVILFVGRVASPETDN